MQCVQCVSPKMTLPKRGLEVQDCAALVDLVYKRVILMYITGTRKILIFGLLRSYCYNVMTPNSAYLIVKHFGKLHTCSSFLCFCLGLR